MSKYNRTGCSKRHHGRFVAVHEYMVRSYAWSRLSPLAKCAWVEIGFLYDGRNNGRIRISSRLLAERLDTGPSAAAKAIRDLMQWGFLDRVKASDFGKKKLCAEYRITTANCDVTGATASKRFLRIGGTDGNVISLAGAAE